MVKAIVDISERSNRILNILKAKHGLRDKSAAIDTMAELFEKDLLEPEFRPEYIEKALKISKEKPIMVGDVAGLRKRYE